MTRPPGDPVRRPNATLFLVLFGLFAWLAASAHAHAARLFADAPGARVEATVSWMVDRGGQRTFTDVASPDSRKDFVDASSRLRSRYDEDPVWIRVGMVQSGGPGDWLVALPTTRIREIRSFGPIDANGRTLDPERLTGLNQPYATRDLRNERFVVRVRLPGPGEYTVWLRVVAVAPVSLMPAIWEPTEYLVARQDKRLFDGAVYGILFTLLVYNLVLGAVLRDGTYGLYVLNCVCALSTLFSFNGHAARYLTAELPRFSELLYVAAPSLWVLCGALFGRSFLGLRHAAPRLDRLAQLIALAALAAFLLAVAGEHALSQRIDEFASAAGIVAFTGIALTLGLRGQRPARWYLAGQAALFAAVAMIVLTNWGVLDAPFVVANGLQLGILGEMVLFSFALSSRIRLIRNENLDLQDTAGRLAVAARTDPLTGLANRAGLEADARRVLAAPGVHGLLLIDLDLFKRINDAFGHQVGDLVLVEVARRLLASVRGTDTVARLGGDEFVVLVDQGQGRAMLEAQAQRLRSAIREPIVLPATTARIDCSIGVAVAPNDGGTLEQLIAIADQAMYRAKRESAAFEDPASGRPD